MFYFIFVSSFFQVPPIIYTFNLCSRYQPERTINPPAVTSAFSTAGLQCSYTGFIQVLKVEIVTPYVPLHSLRS